MARLFSPQEASRLIETHNSLLNRLRNAANLEDKYKSNVISSAEKFVAKEFLSILREIPVEEINRDKNGIKTKPLRDSNFNTIADLYTANVYQIASIRGISEDSAFTIRRIVDEFSEKARKLVKIKISADDKNKAVTELVTAISIYKNSLQNIDNCRKFIFLNEENVKYALEDLLPATSGTIKWFFTAKAIKEKSTVAYNYLSALLKDQYYQYAINELYQIETLSHTTSTVAWDDFKSNSVDFFTTLENLVPGILGTDDKLYGLPEDLAHEIQDECFFPNGLLCSLRRYQEWGVKYILHQEKVLLGDEMGLGKTIQAIATMVSLKNIGATHFVVVCPASVLTNWCREISKHSLLRVTKVHGSGKASAFKAWLKAGGVAVTTYETTSYFSFEKEYKFALLIVDEAHYIKNPEARRTINTVELSQHTDRLLFMTGTALENNVGEMIWLIQLLRPDIANQIKHIAFMSYASQFREKIAPVYYRRKREDVLTELPELIESNEWCSLSPEEEIVYENAILSKQYADARRVSWNIDDLNQSSKARRLLEIVEEAETEGRKIIVFSFFLDTIKSINLFLGKRCVNPINGSVTPQRRQEIIDDFDKAPAGAVLTAQIQSGGTGLNIQSASVVIICEPQFKPSIENQAISRAYRMGQSRNVLVYRLLCENTIDERITEILEEKQQIFDAFADKSVAAKESLALDEKTFGDIINEEIKRINAKYGNIPNESIALKSPNNDSTSEYQTELAMTYDELVKHLLQKYGPSKHDYFTNEYCTSKNSKVTRTHEGLLCHHIDEDKAIMLSNDKFAKNNPFSYQKADRLVYCNILEHLLLHIKITEKNSTNGITDELPGIGGALSFICREINDYYNGNTPTQQWRINIFNVIADNFEEYITILRYLWKVIESNPYYNSIIKKVDLACGWNGNLITKIYEKL